MRWLVGIVAWSVHALVGGGVWRRLQGRVSRGGILSAILEAVAWLRWARQRILAQSRVNVLRCGMCHYLKSRDSSQCRRSRSPSQGCRSRSHPDTAQMGSAAIIPSVGIADCRIRCVRIWIPDGCTTGDGRHRQGDTAEERDNRAGEGGGISQRRSGEAGADAFGLHLLGLEHVIGLRDLPQFSRAG